MIIKQSHRAAVLAFTCLLAAGLFAGCATGGGGSNPFVGTWDLVVESALGTNEQTLVIGADMSGSVTQDGTSIEISNAASDGSSASFDIVFDIQGQELSAAFEGTIDGDDISGEYVTELGNGTVTGTRAQ